jgi:gamma-glutamylputrescine oxidase
MTGAPGNEHVESYYSATTALPTALPPLAGAASADVCVVGAGIAGCSAALALATRGYRVTVLEARRIGWGASGRSGGQIIAGLAIEQDRLERIVGAPDARALWDLSLEAVARLRARIAEHRIECDWAPGFLQAAIKPRQWQGLQRWHEELAQRYGYGSTSLLGREALRALLPSERYLGALYDGNGGHLQPLRYTLGISAAARAAGALFHEGSAVLGYRTHAAGVQIHTAQATLECAQVLFAGNAWLGPTVPALQRRLLTVASYLIATEPLGEQRARALISNNAAVADSNWVLDYFRRSADHRLLFGGRVNYSGVDVRAIAPATYARMLQVYPQLAGTRVEFAWGCLLDITRNRAPDFGRLAPNVYYLQGFSGHGMALAGLAGELVADAIAGTAERFDVFARIPHREFPGGLLLRRPTLALAMLWYRLRDWL